MKITDVPDNDVPAAMEYYRACVAAGTWSPERSRMLLQTQENPDDLIDALAHADDPAPDDRAAQIVAKAKAARSAK